MSFLFGGSPPSPQPINLSKELTQTLKGEQGTAGGFLGLNQQYDPLYNLLGLSQTQLQEFGNKQQPGLLQQGVAATGLQGLGNIGNVAGLGPAAQQAFLAGNPALASGVNTIQSGFQQDPLLQQLQGTASGQLDTGNLSNSPIMRQLQGQAQSELSQGGLLAPDQLRQIQQATRAQFASQGLAGSNPDLASEAVNTSAAQQARLAQAQQFAGGVQGLEQSALGQEQQFGLSTEQELQNFLRNSQLGTQVLSNTTLNPWSAIVGGAPNLPTSGNVYGPTLLPGGNLASQNAALQYQGALNQYGAQQQQLNNLGSSLGTALSISLLASGLGASDERLKEDITDTGRMTPEGIPIKRWRYKGDPEWFEGPVAQDIAEKRPDAVTSIGDLLGLKMVDMNKMGKYFDWINGTAIEQAA